MPITISCPSCHRKFSVSEAMRGKRGKCSQCGGIIPIPAADAPTAGVPLPPTPEVAEQPLLAALVEPEPIVAEMVAAPEQRWEKSLELFNQAAPRAATQVAPLPASPAKPKPGLSHRAWRNLVRVTVLLAIFGSVGIVVMGSFMLQLGGVLGNNDPKPPPPPIHVVGSVLLDPSHIPVPTFVDQSASEKLLAGGVKTWMVETKYVPKPEFGKPQFGAPRGKSSARQWDGPPPGTQMRMRVYLPPGTHEPQSLACVLVAPAGTPLICGADVDDGHAETLPYAQANMAVVMYSLDGPMPASQETEAFREPYKQFKEAGAGVVNGRNALEYALQKLPQVDPARIYCAGHSSAGTVSLLLATQDRRIHGCVVYAPCTDVQARLKPLWNDPKSNSRFPEISQFARVTSPLRHAGQYACPVFLFHARDDSNVPYATARQFVDDMDLMGDQITFAPVDSGGHYQSMIDQGIPQGIAWLKRRELALQD